MTTSLILIGLLALGIGYALGWYFTKGNVATWKTTVATTKKENTQLEKAASKQEKQIQKLTKKLEIARTKQEELEQTYPPQITKLESTIVALNDDLKTTKETIQKLESENAHQKRLLERTQGELVTVKQRYKEDMEENKDWKKVKNKYIRMIKDLQAQVKVQKEKIDRITGINEKQAKELKEAEVFVNNIRKLKARNAKLSEELKYWEQKHYDTHHELAAAKEKLEQFADLQQQSQVKTQQYQSKIEELETSVQQFKDRFVVVNKQYYELLNA